MWKLADLDLVRQLMLDELERDIAVGCVYRSERLTERGWGLYPGLMREAIQTHDDSWLTQEINNRGMLISYEQKRKPKGGYTKAKVPVTAGETLAEGEFNRFYIRGVCRLSINRGASEVLVYRAKSVEQPRPQSQRLIGSKLSASALLADLRDHASVETALGVPAGPNSGLSVRLAD